ncbi:hypothetical protein BD410DRAFT_827228 [Rickenella mellea]|uniref:DUF6533 domain-containing protein n=1 Tax=Rickenella mellea TaxID=50990 RepID=A0A4Y7QBH8_9AGAM|nr:hypothetical protein BD410DRAFT_827228 [Rickenella mellea]
MSDQASAAAQLQAYVNFFSRIVFIRYATVLATAIVSYDYLLTLDQEISEFWHRKFTLASLLFYINRYVFGAQMFMQIFFVTYPLNDPIIIISTAGYISVPGDACGHNPSPGFAIVTKTSGFLSMSFDTVTFWLMFYKTIGVTLQMRKLGMTDSLTYWLLRDGLLYYAGRLLLNGVAVTSLMVPTVSPASQMFLPSLTGSLTNIMI